MRVWRTQSKLVFRDICTKNDGDELEFLDVNHIIDKTEKGGFYVKNYIKPKAKNCVFVNGKSHTSTLIYKSIVFGESVKLRRLCKRNGDNLEAVKAIKYKLLNSCFCKALIYIW